MIASAEKERLKSSEKGAQSIIGRVRDARPSANAIAAIRATGRIFGNERLRWSHN